MVIMPIIGKATYPYHAPPINVNMIPKELVALILTSKMMTASTIERTCFTLPIYIRGAETIF